MGNRISLNLAANVARSLWGVFFGIPAAEARKKHADADVREADADVRRTEASMKKIEGYNLMLQFLENAGFSVEERKAIIADQITEKRKHGDMIENLEVISDLVQRGRIRFQITGETDQPGEAKDDSRKET